MARSPKKLPTPFPFERKPQVPSRCHDSYTKERVDLSKLVATQTYVTAKGVRQYKQHAPKNDIDLPMVYRADDGRAFIADGHHRLVAALKRGERDAVVRVIDIGDPDNPRCKKP